MLIAEELVLLALDPVRGSFVNSSATALKVAVPGALVAELGLAGAVTLVGKAFRVAPTALTRIPDGLLADTCTALEQVRARRSSQQLQKLDRALHRPDQRILERLAATGTVEQRSAFLGLRTRYPLRDKVSYDRVVARIRAAARSDDELDPRTAVLLSLAGPCRLLEVVAPDRRDRKQARRRIAEATASVDVAPAVKKVLQEQQAAVTAATVAATSAAVVSS